MKHLPIKLICMFIIMFSSILFGQWMWSEIPSAGGKPLCLYYHKASDNIYIGCWGGVWKLNNLTDEWAEVDSDPDQNILANAKILSLYLDSENVFYAGTDDRTNAYISYDGGNKWNQINDITFTLQRINCITETKNGSVLFGTNNGIIKTTDHGKTWHKINGFSKSVVSFSVNSNGDVWLGAQGGIFKSTDDGETWLNKSSGLILSLQFLTIGISPTGKMMAGCNQDFYVSENYGDSWQSLKGNSSGDFGLPILSDLIIANDNLIYGCFNRYPYSSTDFGKSWTQITVTVSGKPYPWKYLQFCLNNKGDFFARREDNHLLKGHFSTIIEKENIPITYKLEQNYPNPFNPNTVIQFSIPSSQFVTLKIFDLLGREVKTLVNEFMNVGDYNIDFNADNLSNGMYIYRLSGNNINLTKKMMLMK